MDHLILENESEELEKSLYNVYGSGCNVYCLLKEEKETLEKLLESVYGYGCGGWCMVDCSSKCSGTGCDHCNHGCEFSCTGCSGDCSGYMQY